MRKKITNEDVGKFIGELADQIRSEMNYEYNVKESQMLIAEKELVDSLDEKQRSLYLVFNEKQSEFYDIAKEIYQRKF